MLNRTLLFSVITAAVSALLLFGMSSPAVAADEKAFSFHVDNIHVDNVVIRGQNQSRTPTIGEQFRRMINRILPDDSPDVSNQRPAPVVPPAIPTQPPRPLTNAEIQEATSLEQQRTPTNAGNTAFPRTGSIPQISRDIKESGDGNDSELPTHLRLQRLRDTVFSNPEVERAAHDSRQRVQRATTLVPAPAFQDAGNNTNNTGGLAGNLRDFAELPLIARTHGATEGTSEAFVPLNAESRQAIPRGDRVVPDRGIANPVASPFSPSHLSGQPMAVGESGQRRQLLVSTSPRLEIEIEKPPSANVGQEITYRIRATNAGDVPAEQVVLNVEIPPWIDIRHTDADNGNWVLLPRSDGSGIADLEWRVNRINQGETNLLALWLVPQLHRAIELPIQYNFRRPPIVATVEVQEPKLVMELVGPDEVRWNDLVIYTLIVRNTGNGSAENLRFELQQTSSERHAMTMDFPLLPGEGQEIPIEVRAGRDQAQIDIAILAMGAHDLKSEVRRRIRVMRPKLDMEVQTSPLHFVGEPAEMLIRVVNSGSADAENVIIRAELPLGAQYVASSEGGLFVQHQQQNVVEWRGRTIGRGEVQTLSLISIPRREGECRVSVEASESNGSPLAAGHGTFMAEAIVELDLAVHRPGGPIELGQEVKYTIEVTNTGTKAAENVEISMMFGDQLEPRAVTGRDASYGDGQVFFDKIPTILPKQSVTLIVHVEAKSVGTAQIRAEVVRTDASGSSIRLEQGLSSHVFSRQRGAAATEHPTQNEVFR